MPEEDSEITPDTIDAINKSVIELIQQGQTEEALTRARLAFALASQNLGMEGSSTGDSMNNLAFLYAAQGSHEDAEKLYLGAIACYTDTTGKQHPSSVAAMTNLAMLYLKMGRTESALPWYEALRELIPSALGEDSPQYADNLATLGLIYSHQGRHEEAEPLLLQAIELNRKHLGEDHPVYGQLVETLAAYYAEAGRHHEALPWLERTLEFKQRAGEEETAEYVELLSVVVGLQMKVGKMADAVPRAERLRELVSSVLGENHPSYFNALSLLATSSLAHGRYDEAEQLLGRVLEFQRETLGVETAEYAQTLNLLATLYSRTGAFKSAEQCLFQTIEIRRKVLGEDHEDFAISLNNLAIHYRNLGQFKTGIPLAQQAMMIHGSKLGENHWIYAVDLFYLGDLYHNVGDYRAAETVFLRALQILEDATGVLVTHKAFTLNALAKLYVDTLELEQAEHYASRAVAAFREVEGERGPYYITALGNLAAIYSHREKYDDALALFEQAIGLAQESPVPEHTSILNGFGLLLLRLGNYEIAEMALRQAAEAYSALVGEEHPLRIAALSNLLLVCAATRRYEEAWELTVKIESITDQSIHEFFSLASESQRMGYIRHIQSRFLSSISLVSQHLIGSPPAVQAAMNLVLKRKGIGAEALAAQRDSVLSGKYPHLEPHLRELALVRQSISQMTLSGPGSDGLEVHLRALRELKARREALERQLALEIPEVGLGQKMREVDLTKVAGALPAGSALIEFVHFFDFDFDHPQARSDELFVRARYAAFVLHASKPHDLRMINLGDADELDRLVGGFRAQLTGEIEDRSGRDLGAAPPRAPVEWTSDWGAAVRRAVFDPLLPALGDCRQLLLAPEGELSRFPFEVLERGDGRRLIDDYRISYLSTGRDVLRFGNSVKGQASDPMVIADPDFDLRTPAGAATRPLEDSPPRLSRDLDRGDLHFKRLPGTRIEGERIAEMLRVKPLLDSVALESRVKSCRSPRILHLATHGFFLSDQQSGCPQGARDLGAAGFGFSFNRLSALGAESPLLRSGLALAGANTWLERGDLPGEAEDALLNAEDVSGMDLLATELVTLSACETGLGEIKTGEGVFGLRRAFVLAGARTLVMSLWKVPDQQTQMLMTDFYRRMLEGQPRADALRDAQLALKAQNPDPLYWGAFICQGDPGPLY
jgi:CHAT domain-containing protein/tetratricopeptide (TPR) repeat protein